MRVLRCARDASSSVDWVRLSGTLRSPDALGGVLASVIDASGRPLVVDLREVDAADSLSTELIVACVQRRRGAVLLPGNATPAGMLFRRRLGAVGLDRVRDLPAHLRPPTRDGRERRAERRIPIGEAVELNVGAVRLTATVVDRSPLGIRVDFSRDWPVREAVDAVTLHVWPPGAPARVVRVVAGTRTTLALRFDPAPAAE